MTYDRGCNQSTTFNAYVDQLLVGAAGREGADSLPRPESKGTDGNDAGGVCDHRDTATGRVDAFLDYCNSLHD